MPDSLSSEPIRPIQPLAERWERLIDSISGVVFQCRQSPDGWLTFSFLSSSCRQMLDLDPEAACADPRLLLKMICPESADHFETSRSISMETLQLWEWEGLWRLPSGQIKWFRWRAMPVREAQGETVWDGVMVDITAHISAKGILQQAWEDAGRQDERRHRQLQQTLEQLQLTQFLVDRAPDAILWINSDAHFSYTNPSACQMFGYGSAELLTLSLYDLDPNLSVPAWKERWTSLQSEDSLSFQSVYRKKEGQVFPVEVNLIRLQFGNRQESCAFVRDISDRTAAEQAIRESEAKFRSMVENANDIIYLLTPEGLFSYVTPNCAEIWGYHPSELQGTSYTQFVHPEDLLAYQEALAQPIESGQQQAGIEYRIRHKDGSWRWHASNLSAVQNSRGRVLSVIGIAHDITARVLAEAARQTSEAQLRQQTQDLERTVQKLQQAQTQLVQSEKMSSLGQMVAGIAHEINNPVGFIHGNLKHACNYIEDILKLLELYQQEVPDATPEIRSLIEEMDLDFVREDLPKLLSSMEVGTTRIREIVRSLRNFSRLDEAERKAVDLHSGIDSTLMILGNRLKGTPARPEIAILKEYGNLPHVDCFAGQLNQVFMNIFANAIDAIDEAWAIRSAKPGNRATKTESFDPPQIRIVTEVIPSKDPTLSNCISIRIADNGLGMSEATRQRLFDPFFTTKPVGKGTGLGMSISYQIITKTHGGQLRCISEPGRGTEFFIDIPIVSEFFRG
jgi:two-component system, NtrC family, sensor kinase